MKPSATIFVIDDHAAVRDALGEMLSVFGYRVKTFESADGFLQVLDHRDVGCVVADVRMPGMDGLGLVRELARQNIALPVILISGHADVPMAVAAIKSGAEDFIEKPVDDAQLVAAINRALAQRFERHGSPKLKSIRDAARADVLRMDGKGRAHPIEITTDIVMKFAAEARRNMRTDEGGYCRHHIQVLA